MTGLYIAINSLIRGISIINLLLASLAAVILVLATLMVFAEIISRLLFDHSLIWTVEISGYSLLYMTFLGAPYLLEKNRHVTIDLIANAITGLPGRILGTVVNLFGALICIYFAWYALQVTLDQYQFNIRVTSVLRPSRYLLTMIVPLSMLLLSIQFLLIATRCIRGQQNAA